MLETLAREVIEHWDTQVVAPLIALAAVYTFFKSGDAYLQRIKELNKERRARASNYRDQLPEIPED
jgi:hypothetical protein